ncbi:hypothetical protein PO909_013023 [Leuciscus waleckii]
MLADLPGQPQGGWVISGQSQIRTPAGAPAGATTDAWGVVEEGDDTLIGLGNENRRLRVAWGPEERTLSFGPSSRGARSIGASDVPGDGAACSSRICVLTSGDSDGPSETDVRKGGRGRVGRLGLVGAPLACLKSQTLPCASPRFESTLPSYGLDPDASCSCPRWMVPHAPYEWLCCLEPRPEWSETRV